MEYSNAELAKELGAIVSKVALLEPEINRSSIDSSASKKATEEQSKRIIALEAENESLSAQLAEQADDLKKQQLKDVEHQEAIDKLFRLMTETQKRLDGDSITNISYSNYETVRETIKIISEKMAGKGSVSFDEIQGAIANTRFLWKVLLGTLSVFGVGTVGAVFFTFFGVDTSGKVTLQNLSSAYKDIRKDLDTNIESFKTFKSEDFKGFKATTEGDLKEVKATQNRQWEALLKK